MRLRSRVVASLVVAALVLPLSACFELFRPAEVRPTSTPTGESVAAELEPFYSQVLLWKNCENGLQCATVTAPLDWSDPARASIDLALIRQPATGGSPQGSLLVNPGGPGASGYNLIRDSVDFAVSKRLQAAFDVVGFDPRGVNRSSAISCYSKSSEFDRFLFDILPGDYGSDAWIAEYEKANTAFGQSCLKNTGELLGYVDTVSAARDLDLLRAVLGDKKLTYLGYSYGTLLGATYADLYPQNTGRLVLDGALDPATSSFDVSLTQAEGFESALRAFLADCKGARDCPFRGSVDASMKQIRSLLDRLDQSPLRNADGRELGSSSMTTAIILPLYREDNWQYLRKVFTDVMHGDPAYAFQVADAYYGRNTDGSYKDNSTEAFLAINCLDYSTDPDLAQMRAEEAQLVAAAPVLGEQLAFGGAGCVNWPFAPTRSRGPIAAHGSADILLVGTTNDPATPYVWAQNLAGELERGHLVTNHGEGHTGYNKGSSCVDGAVDDYFITGTVPAADPDCRS